MRQLRILLRDYKIIKNLLSPGRLHYVEFALQASLPYQDLERERTETTHQQRIWRSGPLSDLHFNMPV